MVRAPALVLCACLCAFTARAADWKYMGTAQDGTVVSSDRASISRSAYSVNVWVRMDFARVKSTKDRDQVSNYAVNCNLQTTALLSFVTHSPSGDVLVSWTLPAGSYPSFEKAIPGTIGELIRRSACD